MTTIDAIEMLKKVNPLMPVFPLLGSDPCAQFAVLEWMIQARNREVPIAKIQGALKVMETMDAWQPKKIPD